MLEPNEKGWRWIGSTWLKMAAIMAVGGAGTFLYAHQVEPRWLDWRKRRLTFPNFPRAFNGYRLIQLSDLHLGKNKRPTPEGLRQIVRQINDLRPDAVAITGDFVSHLDETGRAGIAELSRIEVRDGVYGITGNHDYWSGVERVTAAARAAGVQMLFNEHCLIERDGQTLAIAGVDDVWEGEPDLDQALRGVPHNTPVILLAHEPAYADLAAFRSQVVLQLSGHTHGGQIRFPFAGPLVLPELSANYAMGLYHVRKNGHTLSVYTNRGVGAAQMSLRFNCRPEVTIFQLWSE